MRLAPVTGAELVGRVEGLGPIVPWIYHAHEHMDGSGYPDKMVAEDIPLVGRIVAIADAYDAMATDRPYKKALSLEECESILRKTAGKMYDPDLIEVFVGRKLGTLYREDYEDLPYDDGQVASS